MFKYILGADCAKISMTEIATRRLVLFRIWLIAVCAGVVYMGAYLPYSIQMRDEVKQNNIQSPANVTLVNKFLLTHEILIS